MFGLIIGWMLVGVFSQGFMDIGECFLTKAFLVIISRIGENHSLLWCIIGDFNELFFVAETTSVLSRRPI